MNKKLFLLLLATVLFPAFASAQATVDSLLLNVLDNVVWPVAFAAVIVFWVITGILFLSANGDPGKIKLARNSLLAAVGGTIVIILAASAKAIIKNSLGL